MIQYRRPAPPDGFPPASLKKAADAAALAIKNGTPPEFVALWGEWTGHFAEAQFQKCAFCECSFQGSSPNLEHFAPKGEICEVVEAGVEDSSTQRVSGRRPKVLHPVGYWWLAYEWNNWVAACSRCNSAWKKTFFPIVETPYPTPSPATSFTPLLLHPYEGPDPEDHLTFDELGQIAPRDGSDRGRATIDTCQLDRASLVQRRKETVDKVARTIKAIRFVEAGGLQSDDLYELLESICHDRESYAAVARAAVKKHLDLSWQELRDLFGT